MLMGRHGRRRGFTLIETVVTVGIVAALAAVVYPQVVKQFDTADPARAGEDLGNIATAISTFGINVRPQFPSDLEDLVNRPATTGDSTAGGSLYSSSETTTWQGPYVALSIPSAAGQKDTATVTGFGARILNRLHPFDEQAATMTNGGDTVALSASGAEYIAVRLAGLSADAFNSINSLIDGPTELTTVRKRDSGRFRCPFSGAAPADDAVCPNAYFLAVPAR